MYQSPFRDRPGIKRSDQWRSVLDRVRGLNEPELVDWVMLQVEVASNRERGLPDMRPRKNGPTFLVLLEYVANRKRKALALRKWAISADREGGSPPIPARLRPIFRSSTGQQPRATWEMSGFERHRPTRLPCPVEPWQSIAANPPQT